MPEDKQTYVLGIRQYDQREHYGLSPILVQILDEDTSLYNIGDCLESIDDNVDYVCETEGLDRSSFDEDTVYCMMDLTDDEYEQISQNEQWVDNNWDAMMDHAQFVVTEKALRDNKELHQNVVRMAVYTPDEERAYQGEAISVPDNIEHNSQVLENFDFGQVDLEDRMQVYESPYEPSIAILGINGNLEFSSDARWNESVARNSEHDVKEIANQPVKQAFLDKYGPARYGIYKKGKTDSKEYTEGLVDTYDEEAEKAKGQNMWNDQDFHDMKQDLAYQDRRDKRNYDFARDLHSKQNRNVSFGDGNQGTTDGSVGHATGTSSKKTGRQARRGQR